MSEQQHTTAGLSTAVTKVMAIGRLTAKALDAAAFGPVIKKEVPATVNLYLDAKIEQWWAKPDASGVVFLLNVSTPAAAAQILDALPLGQAGMMEFEYIPLGPLTPLRILLNHE